MPDTYDVQNFALDYCQTDAATIAAAIKRRASLLVIGMPGCGKSRLINFMLNRPDVLAQYDLPEQTTFIRVDGDLVTGGPGGMLIEMLRALDPTMLDLGRCSPDELKNRLITAVGQLEPDTDLVVLIDNFIQPLQQALGEGFFHFLFALRNSRPKLNLVYIFIANLKIDVTGFYKLDRLFDRGVAQSICWASPLNRQDTFFSIERQLHKAGQPSGALSQVQKERIFALSGGHSRLTRHLTHLMDSDDISLATAPTQVLVHDGLRAACRAIWEDLNQRRQNLLIDLTHDQPPPPSAEQAVSTLQKYGVLTDQTHFFSPLFECFVQQQEKSGSVLDVRCDGSQTRLLLQTVTGEGTVVIRGLSRRKRKLLCYLVENQGETCSKDQLIRIGWPADENEGVSDRALARQIDGIRRWLEELLQLSQIMAVETVWGEGYQLVLVE